MEYGLACKITRKNRRSLAVANHGVVPHRSTIGDIFVVPYKHDGQTMILSAEVFHDNFYFLLPDFTVDCLSNINEK